MRAVTGRELFVNFMLLVVSLINLLVIYNSVTQKTTHIKSGLEHTHTDISWTESPEKHYISANIEMTSLQPIYQNLEHQLSVQNSIITFLSQPIINNHNFTYIHNPVKTCASEKMEVLFVTPSHPENFENREKIRNGSRGVYVNNSGGYARLLFFLGKPILNDSNKNVQLKIDNESLQYGDIVQDGFDDIYKNVRYKAVSMLKWAVHFCADAKYVIRTDDDVRVEPEKLITVLKNKSSSMKNFIVGSVKINWPPARARDSKYFMSENEYPESTLPPFALGGLLGYPMSSVKLLYQAALRVKPIWLDDVYITAMCAAKVNVSLLQDNDFVFVHRAW